MNLVVIGQDRREADPARIDHLFLTVAGGGRRRRDSLNIGQAGLIEITRVQARTLSRTGHGPVWTIALHNNAEQVGVDAEVTVRSAIEELGKPCRGQVLKASRLDVAEQDGGGLQRLIFQHRIIPRRCSAVDETAFKLIGEFRVQLTFNADKGLTPPDGTGLKVAERAFTADILEHGIHQEATAHLEADIVVRKFGRALPLDGHFLRMGNRTKT